MTAQSTPPPRSLTGLIDALVGYAIDPDQWQRFLKELESAGGALATIDPQVLLSHLSKAETLAWKLRGQTSGSPHANHVVVDPSGTVRRASAGVERLADYLEAPTGQPLRFKNADSEASWKAAIEALRDNGSRAQVLLTLTSETARRFGFVACAADLPDALTGSRSDGYVLLVPNADANDELRALVQNSFSLTAAETELALRLASGAPLKTCAAQIGISVNTARNQLQAVFEKSGIKRQSDLILVIMQLGVMLSGVRDGDGDSGTDNEQPDPEFVVLPDGRRFAYRSYGPAAGVPMLYLHETAGSSLLLPGTPELCTKLGVRLIATERPGVGFSDPNPAYTFASVAADHTALLNQLEIARVGVIGHMSGASHAAALASQSPERVSALLCVNTRVPGAASATATTEGLNLIMTRLLGQPWLLRTFFNILRHRASPSTNRSILRSVLKSPADQRLIDEQPELLEHMVSYSLESLTVSASGMVDEVRCFASGDAIDLDSVQAQIIGWHADDCSITDASTAEAWLEPHATSFERVEEGTTLLLYRRWEEALEMLKTIAQDAG